MELENVWHKPLSAKKLNEIVKFISNEMKDDFQYNQFKWIENKYLKLVKDMEKQEKPKCALIGEDGNIFNLMGIASRTLKRNGMQEEATEMVNRITTNAKSYDEALIIISEYVEITSKEEIEDEEYD